MPLATEYYTYQDRYGEPIYRVGRRGHGEDKTFFIQHIEDSSWLKGLGDVEIVPYNLPEVQRAINTGQEIWLLEGEKDVDTARKQGLVATCNHGGAKKWKDAHSKWFKGVEVINICWDDDAAGRAHAWVVHDSLKRIAHVPTVRFWKSAHGRDFTDHISEGLSVEQLIRKRPVRPKKKPELQRSVERPDITGVFDEVPPIFWLMLARVTDPKPELGKFHQYNALCPAHDDHSPSLSMSFDQEQGKIVVRCQAGCEPDDIAAALQIPPRDLFASFGDNKFEKAVEVSEFRKNVEDEANTRRRARLVGNVVTPWSFAKSVEDKLARPQPMRKFLIDSLMRVGSKVILNADPKAGKTRFVISCAKAICDRQPEFLNYQVNVEDENVLWMNLDMDDSLSYDWLQEASIERPENFILIDGDGYVFPIWEPKAGLEMAELLLDGNCGLWIVDTLAAAASGLVSNENDNFEWYRFFNAINSVRVRAGMPTVLFTHHTSRADKLHGRGASAIEAWASELWYLTLSGGDEERFSQDAARTFRAQGRDGSVAAIELDYNAVTGVYSYGQVTAPERKRLAAHEALANKVEEYYVQYGRWPRSSVVINEMLVGTKEVRRRRLAAATEHGYVWSQHFPGSRTKLIRIPEARG